MRFLPVAPSSIFLVCVEVEQFLVVEPLLKLPVPLPLLVEPIDVAVFEIFVLVDEEFTYVLLGNGAVLPEIDVLFWWELCDT